MADSLNTKDLPVFLFHQGTNYQSEQLMGVSWTDHNSVVFRVWAPNAKYVYAVGDFNNWSDHANPLTRITEQGVWEGEASNIAEYTNYKFRIVTQSDEVLFKADPYARYCQKPPETASVFYKMGKHHWNDNQWLDRRKNIDWLHSPINIYELSISSWRTHYDGSLYTYAEIGEALVPYILEMGYTHVELLPVTEHPFDGSWGYQVTGYFAPTSRHGTPDDFKSLIDLLHQNNIGVIMDWVPAHYPKDAHGLYKFDGDFCYEYSDPQKGEHKGWGTMAFDYGRCEVASFLISSAKFWIEEYHIDGLRVDAVASMLYLDYCREPWEWSKNSDGGRENLEAVALIRRINSAVLTDNPDVLMMAEESTSWPMVTQPDYEGGLGFSLKWNMGWMNDTLAYLKTDPVARQDQHHKLTFAMVYAFNENFILPISHDEVVHGKFSLYNKMWGSYEDKFAGLRGFLGNMMAFPGKKLLFMGCEFGQIIEWDYQKELDWFLLTYPIHDATKNFTKALNHLYLNSSPLWENDNDWGGFTWLNFDDASRNLIAYIRRDLSGNQIAVVTNFSATNWDNYLLGLPEDCTSIRTLIHSDWDIYGGNTKTQEITYVTEDISCGIWNKSASFNIPAFSTIYFQVKCNKAFTKKVVAKKKNV